jgi:hypothetical protein
MVLGGFLAGEPGMAVVSSTGCYVKIVLFFGPPALINVRKENLALLVERPPLESESPDTTFSS